MMMTADEWAGAEEYEYCIARMQKRLKEGCVKKDDVAPPQPYKLIDPKDHKLEAVLRVKDKTLVSQYLNLQPGGSILKYLRFRIFSVRIVKLVCYSSNWVLHLDDACVKRVVVREGDKLDAKSYVFEGSDLKHSIVFNCMYSRRFKVTVQFHIA